jgi:hypothetical protein
MILSFYTQRMSVTLQRVQAASISRQIVTLREGSSRLGVLLNLSSLSLADLFHVGGRFSY